MAEQQDRPPLIDSERFSEAPVVVPSILTVSGLSDSSRVLVVPIIPTPEYRSRSLSMEPRVLCKIGDEWVMAPGVSTGLTTFRRGSNVRVDVSGYEGITLPGQYDFTGTILALKPEGYQALQTDYSRPVDVQPIRTLNATTNHVSAGEVSFIPSQTIDQHKPVTVALQDGSRIVIEPDRNVRDRYSVTINRGGSNNPTVADKFVLEAEIPTQVGYAEDGLLDAAELRRDEHLFVKRILTLVPILDRGLLISNDQQLAIAVQGLNASRVDSQEIWQPQRSRWGDDNDPWEAVYGPVSRPTQESMGVERYQEVQRRAAELGLQTIAGDFVVIDGVEVATDDLYKTDLVPSGWSVEPDYNLKLGLYVINNGMVTYISPQGERLLGYASASNIRALNEGGYKESHETVTVPFSNGEHPVHPKVAWWLIDAKKRYLHS